MKTLIRTVLAGCAATVLLAGCAAQQPELVTSEKSAVELRAMQGRIFETADMDRVYRGIITSFLDSGYAVLEANHSAGTVTAEKGAQLKMTVSIQPTGESRTVVRANAIVKHRPDQRTGYQVDSPEFYQQHFFAPLAQALFLDALAEGS